MTTPPAVITPIEDLIMEIRGTRVLLDADLAKLYGVTTGALVQAVKRNLERFPEVPAPWFRQSSGTSNDSLRTSCSSSPQRST